MLALASESMAYMLGRRTTFADKARQTCLSRDVDKIPPRLEGSVAGCSVSADKRFLTKRYLPGAEEGLRRTSQLFESGGAAAELVIPGAGRTLQGLARACLTETDPFREFRMQRAYYRFSQGRGVIVPKPIEVLHNKEGLVMQYLGDSAVRFSECEEFEALRARAVVTVSHMFFAALHEAGVVHGDISGTNVLINLDSGLPCLVDFGCCEILQDSGKTLLDMRKGIEEHAELEPDSAYVISMWDHRRWDDNWADKLDGMNVQEMNLGSGRSEVPGLALLLRSIFALTMMARSVSPASMRVAEQEWREAFPELVASESKMSLKLRARA